MAAVTLIETLYELCSHNHSVYAVCFAPSLNMLSVYLLLVWDTVLFTLGLPGHL